MVAGYTPMLVYHVSRAQPYELVGLSKPLKTTEFSYLSFRALLCLLALILRSISEASNAFSAELTRLALCKSTRHPQYGHVRVFWLLAASNKPLHLLHSTMTVAVIQGPSSESLFHTRSDNVIGQR
jgi:hypothetical protein